MGDIPEPDEAAMAILEETPSCLTLRCFYLRLSRCEVDESMLDTPTITYIPLSPDTVLEVSGAGGDKQQPPSNITHVDKRSVSFPLRRDRVDAESEEATFVSTTTVRILAGGSVRFEVQNGDERLLVGILETCDVESLLLGGGKSKSRARTWVMKCQVATQRGSGFLRCGAAAKAPPAVEVYVVGVFRGTPVVFTRAMQLRFRRRRPVKAFMDPIPECAEQNEDAKETAHQEHDPAEESEYRCYKPDPEADGDDSLYRGVLCIRTPRRRRVQRAVVVHRRREGWRRHRRGHLPRRRPPGAHLPVHLEEPDAAAHLQAALISTCQDSCSRA